jgi:hypothetical protein
MPRTTANAAEPQIGATESDLNALADESGANMNAVIEASNAMMQGMMLLGGEMVAFWSARWRDGFEASQRLMGCADPNEAFGMQCELARAASQQFFDETAKLMNLAAETAHSSWAPIELRTQAALDRLHSDQ